MTTHLNAAANLHLYFDTTIDPDNGVVGVAIIDDSTAFQGWKLETQTDDEDCPRHQNPEREADAENAGRDIKSGGPQYEANQRNRQ
ncbi:MAG: hypothetical protein AAGG44_12855 [Planctomycetota bacterium]